MIIIVKACCMGQSGLAKSEFLDSVKKIAENRGETLELFKVGKRMCSEAKLPEEKILNLPFREVNLTRRLIFTEILSEIPKYENIVVDTHATFRWKNALFHAFDFDQMKKLSPDMFIVLIDDIDVVYLRLKKNRPSESYSLKDIMVWREEEMIITETLAKYIGVPHYIITRNSGPELIYKLIFEKNLKRVYLSFPISLIRDMPEVKKQVDDFRKSMEEKCIAFDPYKITEKRLDIQLKRLLDEEKKPRHMKVKTLDEDLILDVGEVKQILKDIDGQIIFRDYRLIDQSECIVAFIPTIEGKPQIYSGGERELQYGFSVGKDTFIICDEEKKLSPWAVQGVTKIFKDFDSLIKYFKEKKWIN